MTNNDRVWNGAEIIRQYKKLPGTDPDCLLRDMLADLMHWARKKGVSFEEEHRIAADHFAEEVRG